MIRKYKQLASLSLVLALFFLAIALIYQFNGQKVFAQDQNYLENYEDNYEIPENNNPQPSDPLSEDVNQDPDPGFMEEVEPGEYNQSDDTTILDDNDY